MKSLIHCASLLFLLIGVGCGTNGGQTISAKSQTSFPRESSRMLAAVANNQTNSAECRREAVFLLFHCHVHVGMSLGEIAQYLHSPNWLPDECIEAKRAW